MKAIDSLAGVQTRSAGTSRWSLFSALAGAALLVPQSGWACAACYGQSDSPLAAGMNWGILSLLGMIVFVLGAVAGFFLFLARRAAAMKQYSLPETDYPGSTGGAQPPLVFSRNRPARPTLADRRRRCRKRGGAGQLQPHGQHPQRWAASQR